MRRRVAPRMDHPIDAGVAPIATVDLAMAQLDELVATIKDHSGGARIEILPDGFVRVVLLDGIGGRVEQKLLWPG
jgi:hypothetical protein